HSDHRLGSVLLHVSAATTRYASLCQKQSLSSAAPADRRRTKSRAVLALPHQSALAPWITQLSATLPIFADCSTCRPFSSQIATAPLLLSRQRMSLLPSPLKSPVSTICQLLGTAKYVPLCWTF